MKNSCKILVYFVWERGWWGSVFTQGDNIMSIRNLAQGTIHSKHPINANCNRDSNCRRRLFYVVSNSNPRNNAITIKGKASYFDIVKEELFLRTIQRFNIYIVKEELFLRTIQRFNPLFHEIA